MTFLTEPEKQKKRKIVTRQQGMTLGLKAATNHLHHHRTPIWTRAPGNAGSSRVCVHRRPQGHCAVLAISATAGDCLISCAGQDNAMIARKKSWPLRIDGESTRQKMLKPEEERGSGLSAWGYCRCRRWANQRRGQRMPQQSRVALPRPGQTKGKESKRERERVRERHD